MPTIQSQSASAIESTKRATHQECPLQLRPLPAIRSSRPFCTNGAAFQPDAHAHVYASKALSAYTPWRAVASVPHRSIVPHRALLRHIHDGRSRPPLLYPVARGLVSALRPISAFDSSLDTPDRSYAMGAMTRSRNSAHIGRGAGELAGRVRRQCTQRAAAGGAEGVLLSRGARSRDGGDGGVEAGQEKRGVDLEYLARTVLTLE